jgi:hypothetical protein
MYWRMGLHSIHPEYNSVEYLRIYNPRMNAIFKISVDKISSETIKEVEREVIGYDDVS